ncbi:MAG TPA: helix-turn-helix domain-containing protein [Candidatus Kapabacteria bacterium]|nr:helix-turn-helix domain-containing protein [Candidatus Kapabacteria bacterium]HPO63382.1 helix-turn-helix domain-containing protein [Candidatus Kapabacteria bacterium]
MQSEVKLALLNSSELETAIERALNKSNSQQRQENAESVHKTEENIKFFSIKEACKILGCCRTTIFNWCRQGLISYKKIGRRILFRKSDLENCGSTVFIESNRMNLTINGGRNEL